MTVIPYKKPLPTPSTIPGLLHSQSHSESDSPTQNKSNQPPASIQEEHKHTCIVSVIAHHSLTFGLSRIRFISPSKSSPIYLKLETSVRSLSKNIESGRCLVKQCSLNGCRQGGGYVQSLMLHSSICRRTSGQTFAWHSLYAWTADGLRWISCAMRRVGPILGVVFELIGFEKMNILEDLDSTY